MNIIKTNFINKSQWTQINDLWNEEYPIRLIDRFDLLLQDAQNFNHYLIEEKKEVVAWAVEFQKENEKRFSLIVKNKFQGKGLGKILIKELINDLGEFYGWVIDHDFDVKSNGEVYRSPINFYLKLGFHIIDNERIDNEMINAVKIKFSK
jgi:ribosomal protein S18 acetylase RimI-like enzyme